MSDWLEIPGFSRYLVSADGKRLVRRADMFEMKVREKPTSKGTYLTCNVIGDDGIRRTSYSFHKLVCLAHHGPPPTEKHTDVNHKDGDKHNNSPENLEWCTRSENVSHSYRTGLRKDARRVLMYDHEKGEEVVFQSMAELARWANLPHLKGWYFAKRYEKERYKGRYTFQILGDHKPPRRKNARSVHVLDIKNRKLYTFCNLAEMENELGIKRGTIQAMLNYSRRNLFNGHLFWWTDAKAPDIPCEEDVDESIKQYAVIKKRLNNKR